MPNEPRKCTAEDLDWLMDLARHAFGNKVKDYLNARRWVEKALSTSKVLILRTDDSALVALCGAHFFDPGTPQVTVQFFAGRSSGVECLFEALKPWARAMGASEIYFQPKTGYNAKPLADKIGAISDFSSYVWRF